MANSSVKEDYLVVYNDINLKTSSVESNDAVKDNITEDYSNFGIVKVSADAGELDDIKNDPSVKYVVPDVELELCGSVDNDLQVVPAGDLSTLGQQVTWGASMVLAPNSWANGYTGQNVKVAVLDTGIAAHSDLLVSGRYDAVTAGGNANDVYGHGTAVAGIIAAKNNSIGLVGIAPDVSLYAVRVMESETSGSLSDLIEGIDWAVDNDMDVANISLGVNPANLSDSDNAYVTDLLNSVTTDAFNSGLIIVAASGNDGHSTGADNVSYPARSNDVIGVGAIDSSKNLASFSSIGPSVDLVAPGVSFYTTGLNDTYVYGSGTSFATPEVVGLVALYKQKYPTLTNSQLVAKIISNANDLGAAGFDNYYGNGLSVADITTIPAPSVNAVDDACKTVTGSGGPANGTVEVTTSIGTFKGSTDASGNFSVALSSTLNAGSSVSVVVKDSSGNCSSATVVTVNMTQGLYYSVHVQNIGWQDYRSDGITAGTSGQSLRLEAIKMNLGENYSDGTCVSGSILYNVHVQNIGWQGFRSDGTMAGTSGLGLRLEAIQIKLSGDIAANYDVYYCVHAENFGWMGWAKNGESAGTAGYSYRLEGIKVVLVPKGGAAPGSTVNAFKQK